MDLYSRQQFDFLLQTATERFVARLEERHRGPEAAAVALRSDPTAATVEEALAALARGLFAELLLTKTVEALDQHAGYQAVGTVAT